MGRIKTLSGPQVGHPWPRFWLQSAAVVIFLNVLNIFRTVARGNFAFKIYSILHSLNQAKERKTKLFCNFIIISKFCCSILIDLILFYKFLYWKGISKIVF